MRKCMIIYIAAWVAGALVNLAIIGGLIYAAAHFISKFW